MKKPALLIFSLCIIIVILSLVRIFVSNSISTSGLALGKIQEQTENYKLENNLLSEKLLSISSLTNIYDKAYDLGYTEAKTELVLTQKLPVAIKR